MKYRFLLLFMLAALPFKGFTSENIDERILQIFQTNFPAAQEVAWVKLGEECEVTFVWEGLNYRIWFQPDGNATKVFRYSDINFLPPYINLLLHKKYKNKVIFGVKETMSEKEISYEIIMRDENYWYYIMSDAYGHFHLENKFLKAN